MSTPARGDASPPRASTLRARTPRSKAHRTKAHRTGLDEEPRGDAGGETASGDLVLEERRALQDLRGLVERSGRGAGESDALELLRLYRLGCTVLARLEASGSHPRAAREVRRLVDLAQVRLFRRRTSLAGRPDLRARLRAVAAYLLERGPRAVRAEWRLLALSFALFYGLAALAYVAVARDLPLAYSLLSPPAVDGEIAQLQALAPGESFRGNFTFGLGESPTTATMILLHNMGVGLIFFVSALVPPLYLVMLSTNALMVGTYTAVASHWGQAGAISSRLWCHGTLELQALVLAATAGLVLVRAVLVPGPWSRTHALALAGRRAFELFLPTFALLFVAGVIEGFVTPHAPTPVRLSVAVVTGALLVAWAWRGGRSADTAA